MKTIFNVLLLLLLVFTTSVSAEDKRKVVELSKQDREMLLSEMRIVLESIHDIVAALDNNDMKAVAVAASQSKNRIKIKSKDLLKALPSNFELFANSVQKGFAQMEESAQSGGDKGKMISLLSDQLGRCVACHTIYKLK